ncbi:MULTISPECIES: hypothetical protein [unclassified Lysinibacillus]
MKKGSQLFTKVIILKLRREKPTVIEFNGDRYVKDNRNVGGK